MKELLLCLFTLCILISGCTGSQDATDDTTEPTLCSHLWQETDCVTRSVCIKCGLEGACGGHWFSPASCTYPGICAVCGAESPALGHDMMPAECTSARHCSRCDYTEGEPLGHEGESVCARCSVSLEPRFEIILQPGSVQRDTTATLSFMGDPETLYSITVYVKSGASKAAGLEPRTSDATGYVSWSWHVGSSATPGTYKIVITSEKLTQVLEYTIIA